MNPQIKHFFFSQCKTQFEGIAKQKNKELAAAGKPILDYGEILSLSFLIDHNQTLQVLNFEKLQNDTIKLSDKERDTYAKVVGVDIKSELATCKSICIEINIKKKFISTLKSYTDRESVLTYL
jgi:hypothetical protein